MKKTPLFLIFCLLILSSLGCSMTERLLAGEPQPTPVAVTQEAIAATATSEPQPTIEPTVEPTLAPVFAQITTSTQERETQDPPLIIEVESPVLAEAPGVTAGPFNQAVQDYVARQMQSFEENIQPPFEGQPTGPNSLTLRYEVLSTGPRLLSVYYPIMAYMAGAAHPSHWSETMTYDMQTGQMLALADLFTDGTDYLALLSQASLEDLKRQGTLEWEEGAAPQEINFKSWNVTPQGLRITFDRYQVASYAAGDQIVTLPWDSLSDVLSDDYRELLLAMGGA